MPAKPMRQLINTLRRYSKGTSRGDRDGGFFFFYLIILVFPAGPEAESAVAVFAVGACCAAVYGYAVPDLGFEVSRRYYNYGGVGVGYNGGDVCRRGLK